MHRHNELYEFLLDNSWEITEQWYQQIEGQDESSIYSAQDTATINSLKEKNQEYVMQLHRIFNTEEKSFFENFKEWTAHLAKDQKHLDTDVHYVVGEFNRTQEIYLSYIQKFYKENQNQLTIDQFFTWSNIVRKVINLTIYIYIDEANKNTKKQIAAQKEMINELSSPVILLQNDVALLPLIGDIDTARAKLIIENTLAQSSQLGINHLCIDLSGVAIIDTMVAHEIFNLIKALKLLGISTTLSGIRPEIAQTAIQLGLDFDEVHTAASLAQALEKITKG